MDAQQIVITCVRLSKEKPQNSIAFKSEYFPTLFYTQLFISRRLIQSRYHPALLKAVINSLRCIGIYTCINYARTN